MDASMLLRQLLRTPRYSIHFLSAPIRPQSRAFALLAPSIYPSQQRYLSVPRIITPSFWASLIPKPLRKDTLSPSEQPVQQKRERKEWNPATPYMILGLLIGSQAIQILWLKRDRDHFTRKAEAKIGILREVIEKVQRGEDVDVEKVLGTGDKTLEKEWDDVLKEIGDEEVLYRSKKRRRELRAQAAAELEGREQEVKVGNEVDKTQDEINDGTIKVESIKGARFY